MGWCNIGFGLGGGGFGFVLFPDLRCVVLVWVFGFCMLDVGF